MFKTTKFTMLISLLLMSLCTSATASPLSTVSDVRWALLDSSGNVRLLDPNLNVLSRFSGGVVVCNKRKTFKLTTVTASGVETILNEWRSPEDSTTRLLRHNIGLQNGMILVCSTSGVLQYYFVNKAGRKVIDRGFTQARPFGDGVAPVIENIATKTGVQAVTPRRWSVIDQSGKTVVPASYTAISRYSAGRAVASREPGERDKLVLDERGKVLFSRADVTSIGQFSKDGYAVYKASPQSKVRCGLVDRQGRTWAPNVPYANFSEQLGLLERSAGDDFRFADMTGKVQLKFPCRASEYALFPKPVFEEGWAFIPTTPFRTRGYRHKGFQIYFERSCLAPVDKKGGFLKIKGLGSRVIVDALGFNEGFAVIQTAIVRTDEIQCE